MESNDEARNELRNLTEEEKQEYLIDNGDLSFDEYESLSDDEKMKYHEKMFPEKRSIEDISKDLKEVIENLRKKRLRNKE